MNITTFIQMVGTKGVLAFFPLSFPLDLGAERTVQSRKNGNAKGKTGAKK